MKIESTFAILDVKAGRDTLSAMLAEPRTRPGSVRVPVVIHGFVDYEHSRDDGESREFSVSVTKLEVRKAEAR